MNPRVVRVIRNWDFPDLLRQSPGGSGRWGDIRVVEDDTTPADYVVVLNQPSHTVRVTAPPQRVWALIQEPPTTFHRYLHRGQRGFHRIHTSDPELAAAGGPWRASQPALPWHVMRSFDELTSTAPIPDKRRDLSWITSTQAFLPGHRRRLAFLARIRSSGVADLFGRGLNPVEDKWDALAPYRYAIVFENHIGPYYWSEKLADCFLTGTMPIYVGCTNLGDYFPQDSYIAFDPTTADPVTILRRIIDSDLAERSHAAIIEARRRCLYEHQLFPFLARETAADREPAGLPRDITLYRRRDRHPLRRAQAFWHWRIAPRLRGGAS